MEKAAGSQESLDEIYRRMNDGSFKLPRLKDEPSSLQKMIADLKEWVQNLLADWFDFENTGGINSEYLTVILKWGLFFVILALFFLLAKNFFDKKQTSNSYRFSKRPRRRENSLESDLIVAIEKGDWALATRIRWQISLKRRRVSAGLTPLEDGKLNEFKYSAIDVYRVMFAYQIASESWFNSFDTNLQKIEGLVEP